VNKLYVDGCSFTYGQGLDRKFSIGNQIGATLDLSTPGKSNTAMAVDLYKNIHNFDVFVIGLTYPSRYTFYDGDTPVHLTPGTNNIDLLTGHPMGEFIETTYPRFYKVLWALTNSDEMRALSDFYINAIIRLLEDNKKQYVIYSWEALACTNKNYFVPRFHTITQYRLPDGHLNEQGMTELANTIKEKLNVKK
jgi:hypothetical protein